MQLSNLVVFESPGPSVLSLGPLVPWSFSPLVLWSLGPLVPWSSGPLVLWSSGPLVLPSFGGSGALNISKKSLIQPAVKKTLNQPQ